MPRLSALRVVVTILLCLCCLAGPALAGGVEAGAVAVVIEDGVKIRKPGGKDHDKAPVAFVAARGDFGRILRVENGWAEASLLTGAQGWIPLKALAGEAEYLAAPENKDAVYCPADLPREFASTIKGSEEQLRLRLEDVPTLYGGGARLTVVNQDGQTLWRGPAPESAKEPIGRWSPLFFYCNQFGNYWPSVLGDVDGDGKIDLVAREPQSDVSVSSFSFARWEDGRFTPLRHGLSLVESTDKPGRYAFQVNNGVNFDVRWIMNLEELQQGGEARVSVFDYGPYVEGAGARLMIGKALVRFNHEGADLINWLEPLKESTP